MLEVHLTYEYCETCGRFGRCVFGKNTSHELNKMAKEAGIYKEVWRPEEAGITKASQLINLLEEAIIKMSNESDFFKKFNPPDGYWGTYEVLLNFLEELLIACKKYPDSRYVTRR